MMEFHRIVEIVGAVESDDITALRIAEVDISVGELDRGVAPKLIGQTGMQRPREIRLARRAGVGVAAAAGRATRAVVTDRYVAEITDRVAAEPDTGAEEGREIPPGAEIDVAVEQESPFGLAGEITVVGKSAAGDGADIECVEIRLPTVFTGYVETQPVIECVADTEPEQRRCIEALVDVVD